MSELSELLESVCKPNGFRYAAAEPDLEEDSCSSFSRNLEGGNGFLGSSRTASSELAPFSSLVPAQQIKLIGREQGGSDTGRRVCAIMGTFQFRNLLQKLKKSGQR